MSNNRLNQIGNDISTAIGNLISWVIGGEQRPALTLIGAFTALALVCGFCGLTFYQFLDDLSDEEIPTVEAAESFNSMVEEGTREEDTPEEVTDPEPEVEEVPEEAEEADPNENPTDLPSEPPPDGDWILTYTDGEMICPGVGKFPAALLEPHPITITHEEEDGSLYAITPEGPLHFFPGVLPAVPVDGVEGDGVINSSGISVESADDLVPHPSKYTATYDADGVTLTYEMQYGGENQIIGTTSNVLKYEELDTTCFIIMDVIMDYDEP